MATRPARRTAWKELRKHIWFDANGRLIFEHRKVLPPEGKETWNYRHPVKGRVCLEHPDAKPNAGWCPRKPEVASGAMWRLPELLDAIASGGRIAWVCGEKDAEALRATGEFDAVTTVHQGEAAEIYSEQIEYFRDCGGEVWLFCDDDSTGWAYGLARAEALVAVGVPGSALRLRLPAEGFNDVYDHLNDASARALGWRVTTGKELRAAVRAAERKKSDGGGSGGGASSEQLLEDFLAALEAAGCKQGTGQDWTCPHPEHADEHPSFGVKIGDNGGLLLNCQKCMPRSGTPAHDLWRSEILDALGLDADAIAPPKRRKSNVKGQGEKESVADKLVAIAQENYTLGINDEGRPFAYLNGGHVVSFFDKGNGQFGATLAREYNRIYRRTAGSASVHDALNTLTGYAQDKEPEEIALRVAAVGGGESVGKQIIIDMGDSAESVVVVGPEGWAVGDRSSMLFRRTKAMMAYLPPVVGSGVEGIERFHDLLNVTDEDFDLVVAWMVATFIPDIQIPAMMLNGEHGTGKSDATRMITMLIDPSVAPLRKRPRDEREWSVAASASRVISLENMSWIEPWLSDDLCTAITGAGDIERQYHTNDDIRIRKIKRVVLVNGIDPGGVRGDLADRMFAIRLQKISIRLSELALERKFQDMCAELFGSLLDLLVEVQKVRLSGRNWVETNERMHDFALVCKAVDLVRGSASFERYCELKAEGTSEVTEDDPLTAIVKRALRESKGGLSGTASAIYEALDLDGRQSGIPKTARALSQAMTRLTPGWEEMGIVVDRRKVRGVKLLSISLAEVGGEPENDDGE